MERNQTSCEGPLALLLAASLASSFIQPFGQAVQGGSAQNFLLASCILFPVLCGILTLYCYRTAGRKRPLLFDGLLAGVLMLSAAMEMMQCQRFYAYVLGPHLPLFWFLLLTFLVTAYCRTMSKGALARTAQIVLLILGISLMLMVAAVLGLMRVENLSCRPINKETLASGLMMRAMLLPEYLLLPVLADRCKNWKSSCRTAAWMVGLLFVIDGLLAVTAELVLGSHVKDQAQALYSVARLGGISVFRRLDALHVCVWLMLYFVKISLYFENALQLMGGMCRKKQGFQSFALMFAATMILFAVVWRCKGMYIYWVQQGILIILLLLPLFWRKEGIPVCKERSNGAS